MLLDNDWLFGGLRLYQQNFNHELDIKQLTFKWDNQIRQTYKMSGFFSIS